MPKYSLTSQNPASLTCERNTDPAPMASTSSAAATGEMSAAIGAMMPPAVIVATVAEPVARRTATATSQPAIRIGIPICSIHWAMTSAIPDSTSVSLKPPPAPTMRRMDATGASEEPTMLVTSCVVRPLMRPRTTIAYSTVSSSATIGSPTNVSSLKMMESSCPIITISTTVRSSIKITGIKTTEIATPNDGRCPSRFSVSEASPRTLAASRGTHLTITFAASGPEMMTVGTATRRPRPSVMPIFAFSASIAMSGPGCGGTSPCSADKPASAGIPTATTGSLARRATSMTTGISSTMPTSKNSGIPTTKATSAIAHGKRCGAVFSRTVSTIWSAPPESIRSLPMMAPNAIRTPTPPTVDPTPLVNAVNVSVSGMPAINARTADPSVSARNGCILRQTISTMIVAIPASAATSSCATLSVCCTPSAAPAMGMRI